MTSDARIEIAERMRGPFGVCECVGHTYMSGTLFGMQVGARDEMDLRIGMLHLAELIDPTCHIDTSGEWHGSPVDSVCSECFSPLYRGMRYCPHCGCRVVTDDGRE